MSRPITVLHRLAMVVSLAVAGDVTARQAFHEVRVAAGLSETLNRDRLHDWWRPTTGGHLRLETPFHFGFVELGARYDEHVARTPAVPDFGSLFVFSGWGLSWSPVPALRVAAGVRVGSLAMRFHDPDDPWGRSESELALAAAARVELLPVRHAGLFLEVGRARAFTHHRIRLDHGSAGVLFRFRAPAWLRRFLE